MTRDFVQPGVGPGSTPPEPRVVPFSDVLVLLAERDRLWKRIEKADDEIERLKTRGGIARSLIPASQIEKFHERCEALGV